MVSPDMCVMMLMATTGARLRVIVAMIVAGMSATMGMAIVFALVAVVVAVFRRRR